MNGGAETLYALLDEATADIDRTAHRSLPGIGPALGNFCN